MQRRPVDVTVTSQAKNTDDHLKSPSLAQLDAESDDALSIDSSSDDEDSEGVTKPLRSLHWLLKDDGRPYRRRLNSWEYDALYSSTSTDGDYEINPFTGSPDPCWRRTSTKSSPRRTTNSPLGSSSKANASEYSPRGEADDKSARKRTDKEEERQHTRWENPELAVIFRHLSAIKRRLGKIETALDDINQVLERWSQPSGRKETSDSDDNELESDQDGDDGDDDEYEDAESEEIVDGEENGAQEVKTEKVEAAPKSEATGPPLSAAQPTVPLMYGPTSYHRSCGHLGCPYAHGPLPSYPLPQYPSWPLYPAPYPATGYQPYPLPSPYLPYPH